jgi:UrcA family protein
MRNQVSFLGAIFALAAISATDIAQSAIQAPDQVTQSGPYVIRKSFTSEPFSAPRTITRMSRGISYRDLDLTSDADVAKLEARVKQTAQEVCRQLDRPPKSISVSRNDVKACIRNASENALADVRTAVASARANNQAAQNR